MMFGPLITSIRQVPDRYPTSIRQVPDRYPTGTIVGSLAQPIRAFPDRIRLSRHKDPTNQPTNHEAVLSLHIAVQLQDEFSCCCVLSDQSDRRILMMECFV